MVESFLTRDDKGMCGQYLKFLRSPESPGNREQ